MTLEVVTKTMQKRCELCHVKPTPGSYRIAIYAYVRTVFHPACLEQYLKEFHICKCGHKDEKHNGKCSGTNCNCEKFEPMRS